MSSNLIKIKKFYYIFSCSRIGILTLILALVLNSPGTVFSQSSDNNQEELEWIPGEYIVRYNNNEVDQLKKLPGLESYSNDEIKEALTQILEAENAEHIDFIDAEAIRAHNGEEINVDVAVDLLDSEIADYISPNFIRKSSRTPNDPSFGSLWGLSQSNGIDISAPEAWDNIVDDQTEDIVVGVIDTGVDYNHPDLKANMWINPGELNGSTGQDSDSNGVVDDLHGFNAITNSGNPFDDQGHGTHCAGTIGAVGNNGLGITGVAWKTKIMALKFLDSNGSGSDVNAIKAIQYAVANKNKGGNLKVLNNSWGGSGYNHALKDAIEAANDAGILFVAAAGNDGRNNDNTPTYPAGYNVPNVISVAAIDQNGSKASFSNYGESSVHLAAPGVSILSTIPGGSYASYQGTSMAAPHVSGVGVLAYSKVLSYAPSELRSHLLQNIKPLSQLEGLMQAPGIVDARAAAMDPDNFPPAIEDIKDQIVSEKIRKKRIPLIAYDKENDPLTFKAKITVAEHKKQAAAVDEQYKFNSYEPQYDNYYGIGEKRITSSDGKIFFIFSNGSIYELNYPYYSYRTSVASSYYNDPDALVNAYPVDTTPLGSVTVYNSSPAELEIVVAPDNKDGFEVEVEVSDGERKDFTSFTVKLGGEKDCS